MKRSSNKFFMLFNQKLIFNFLENFNKIKRKKNPKRKEKPQKIMIKKTLNKIYQNIKTFYYFVKFGLKTKFLI